MANAPKTYAVTTGVVQQFPEKPVVTERDLNGQTIREFTIKSATSGKLVRVTLGDEFGSVGIPKGAFVAVDGAFTSSEVKGVTYYNIWAKELSIVSPVGKAGREVVNAAPATEAAPF